MATRKKEEMKYLHRIELSSRELFFIGNIVAQWGCLEHEIFCQTVLAICDKQDTDLPKKINGINFLDLLSEWEKHVVNKATKKRKGVLKKQHKQICHYLDFRNALVHGMWEWDMQDPKKIISKRIRKKQIISTIFTAEDLEDFVSVIGEINFKIRYPNGTKDLVKKMMYEGSYMSRSMLCMMTGNPLADELLNIKEKQPV